MEEGGSYLPLIYLFSSFLPQVAMVIPSSLSLRTRRDGHPSVNTPVPSLSPGGGSVSPQPRPGCPRSPQLRAAHPPSGEVRREQPKQHRPFAASLLPRSELLPSSGSAAGEGAAGRDSVPGAPRPPCPVPSPGAGGGRRSPGPVAAAAPELCPRAWGWISHPTQEAPRRQLPAGTSGPPRSRHRVPPRPRFRRCHLAPWPAGAAAAARPRLT